MSVDYQLKYQKYKKRYHQLKAGWSVVSTGISGGYIHQFALTCSYLLSRFNNIKLTDNTFNGDGSMASWTPAQPMNFLDIIQKAHWPNSEIDRQLYQLLIVKFDDSRVGNPF